MAGANHNHGLSAIGVVVPALASVAGFVDAVGFVTLRGLFVAHMSGNSVRFGVDSGHGAFAAAEPAGFAVLLFVSGVAVGTVAAELATRRRFRSVAAVVLAIEAALTASFMLYGTTQIVGRQLPSHSLQGFYLLAGLAIVSMGIQTAALRQLGGRTISTTYVTGVLTAATQEAANYLFWIHDGRSRDERHSFLSRVLRLGSRRDSRDRVLLLGGVWAAYVVGAVVGALLDARIELWSLLVPLGILLAVIARDVLDPLEF